MIYHLKEGLEILKFHNPTKTETSGWRQLLFSTNKMNKLFLFLLGVVTISCKTQLPISKNAVKPVVITQAVENDTDDPAIWINPDDYSKSLIIGTDKETNGALYAFDLDGKIVKKSISLKRPNNVDIAYNFSYNNKKIAIAITTERETNKIRIFSLPDLEPIDQGGISVFEGETDRGPMGLAIYTREDGKFFVIVGRKTGPTENYLWQYELNTVGSEIQAKLVRKFGKYSGKKEIEAIAVDNELGYIYYSDEGVGIRKYIADPSLDNNQELTLFGNKGFRADHEGISIYKTGAKSGYILVSNQQANSFIVFSREGSNGKPNYHVPLAEIPVTALESDGSEVSALNFGPKFPKGIFVAMSNGKVFHYYDWRDFEKYLK